jgi:signal transduction histidine kinase
MANKKRAFNPETLRKFPFFASFSTDQLKEISKNAPKISLKTKAVVFRQGELSETMYLILKGSVKIERGDDKGGIFSVGRLSEYQVFGELAMLSKEPRQATVTAIKDTELLAIDRSMMLDIIRKSDPVGILEIFSVLSDQIRAANDSEFKDTLSRRTLEAQMEVEKQRALTQMVAGVAHEINTPLGIINTAVSIMARELAAPVEVTTQRAADIAESLELMRRNVERAHRLVQDFKKVSVSQLTDKKEFFDISEVIEETIGLIMFSLKRSRIQVNFQNKLTLEQNKWFGYRGFLSQVLINLLTNVERYAYSHEVGGIVDVTLKLKDDKHYCLIVRDYGRGISKEDQARAFEPFFTTGRPIGGTGLGLAIVHNLVTNAMKGEIKLKSNQGKGTEFIVTFPRVISE